ncbi:MAG TPA: DNA mismatch repair endonuclease MutL [Planctomycetaceae bacterium]|nr:DNA mismatch repair endonuclease MutL [Planctomycetaceae bacterium]
MSVSLSHRIRRLDATVINKIAAGEVIERPASVVKELLENSIDALSHRIEIDLVDGGTELIRIVDDGEGIHPEDLILAVSSHATSKIESDADLFSVKTMGFRGEALASVASVSKFRIRSRRGDADSAHELLVDGGLAGEIKAVGGPEGTLIEVRQLFHNTPVRRKFLKTKATEFGHISEQFTRIALAHPNLHLVLRHNGKTAYELPATQNLLDRLQMFYGEELANHLIPVEGLAGDDLRMWGYAAHPSQSKSTRKGQYLYLNGRWIQDRTIQAALSESYRGLLMVGRHPVVFLFLEVPSEDVDVNVHPCKWEVRFRESQQIYRLVLSTIRDRFLGMDLNSELPSGGGTQTSFSETDREEQRKLKLELADWAKTQLDRSISEFAGIEPRPVPPAELPSESRRNVDLLPTGFPSSTWSDSKAERPNNATPAEWSPPAALQSYLGGAVRAMQVMDCYLVVDDERGLMIIDQHALHERIMYEFLRARVLDGSVESQKLLIPLSLELAPSETALLLEHRELLSDFGYGVEEFGRNTLLVNRYPVLMRKADHARILRDLVPELDTPGRKLERRDLIDSLLHMMSCKAAVKSGDRLTAEEIESLLAQRHLVDDAHHCPHGRPTSMVLTREQLDRQFGRLGT